jgi:hypothetical protein
MKNTQIKGTLTKEAQEFINDNCPPNLTEADILEIEESLYHLGKAIVLYSEQKKNEILEFFV